MKRRILITGGTGLIGKRLTTMLLAKDYTVRFLSRSKKSIPDVEVFTWNPAEDYIEAGALEDVEAIIHLAGENVAEKAWTEARKKQILESRTLSTRLLAQKLKTQDLRPKAFISASAMGIYGNDTGEALITEGSPFGTDFLAEVTKAWEEETTAISPLGIRTVLMRIGVVLDASGGALEKIAQPIRYGAGAALASGKQWMSWIHVEDVCRMFVYALENEEISGAYNAVGTSPVTNAEFTRQVAKMLKKPLILPNVPTFALKMLLGEMASMVIGGSKIMPERMLKSGFQFNFDTLESALQDLLL